MKAFPNKKFLISNFKICAMSNKKEISSEAAKINIEVTVQQPETTSDLLKENSTELVNYIANLVGNNQRNPKLICLLCWCQLTYFQKQQHLSNHTNYLRTASYYTEKLTLWSWLSNMATLKNKIR